MSVFPKIEKITLDTSVSHFLLMFGYKLFSLYFPLFLIWRGLSLPEVGYTYLLIYLPIAVFAPLVGFFSHKISPVILAVLGILGYGVYCLGMIVLPISFLFYFFQILLGISAALFFVSMRGILMSSKLENPNRAFAWFYSAPYYASAIAPAVGALIIWQFNFFGVFAFSLVLQFFNAIFCITQLNKQKIKAIDKNFRFEKLNQNYQKVFEKLKETNILIPIAVSFSVLLLAGFYRAFFVLFLKDLEWSQNLILLFVSLLSLVFLPISLFAIKRIGKLKSSKNIFQGATISGVLSIILGGLGGFANFYTIFLVKFGQSISGLMSGSGRSGLLSKKLKKYPEEASALDTIFSPLGVALGSLVAGLIIGFLGFSNLFILGGIFVVIVAVIGNKLFQEHHSL
ncbi:MFS transporter [Candidatus Parcubacteria bacterium]|nr:MFS transporter [Candidatus Parcubacteria bacterium]